MVNRREGELRKEGVATADIKNEIAGKEYKKRRKSIFVLMKTVCIHYSRRSVFGARFVVRDGTSCCCLRVLDFTVEE